MVGRSALILSLAIALTPPAFCGHLVEDVAQLLNKKIDFVGHDNGLRSHISTLEKDFKELDNLDNEAWQHSQVQRVLTSLTDAVTVLRRVEDHVVSLARTSRTDVVGLETHLNQFKRQVDGRLSTDYIYGRIMGLVGSLIEDSYETMKKEIVEINKAEELMNKANGEIATLKGYLKLHEKHQDEADRAAKTGVVGSLITAGLTALFGDSDKALEVGVIGLAGLFDVYDHRDTFDRVEKNILDCFRYFQNEVYEIEREEDSMRKLKNRYFEVGSWSDGYDKQDLVDAAENESDWNDEVMANIKSLKSSVISFVNSAGQW